MTAYLVDGVLIEAEQLIDGTLVGPKLPPEFDETDNGRRPVEQSFWWQRPYIVPYRDNSPEFLTHWPEAVRYDVRCLDGGAWDRSTWWSSWAKLEDAVEGAKSPPPHGLFFKEGQWPGQRRTRELN